MRVIVSGAVKWENAELIIKELKLLPQQTVIIHGDSPGADALCGEIVCKKFGFSVEKMAENSDDYKKYKRGAWKGLNERMLNNGAELVLCFHPAIHKSKGTKHLADLAEKAGVKVKVING